MNNFTAEQRAPNVLHVHFDDIYEGWHQWIMLSSDRHHDNIACDRKLEQRHLDKAKERGALIIDVGDLFCAMQGKYDPRRSMDDIRPEDVGADYLDRIVMHAAEFYGPYAANWLMIGRGNHDQGILSHCGTDLVSNLTHRLNGDFGGHVYAGGYGGWVHFFFKMRKTVGASRKLKYFHGSGGGGPVTRGVIQTNRQAVYLPDADIVTNGHTHDAWYMPIARERLSKQGVVGQDLIHFIRTPTYKNDYGDGSGGWHVERGMPPKPKGCAWLHFVYDREGVSTVVEIDIV